MFDDGAVAAGRDSGPVSHTEGHVECLRLRMDSVLPPGVLARRSRGRSLDRSSPALRICMETTRASLLWQAAAVRPEPEKTWFEIRFRLERCIARVWDCSCFAILTNVAAEAAWSDAPSRRGILSVVLSVRMPDIALKQ